MTISNRGFALAAATLALMCAGPAAAQDNYDQGKSGAQLFASDCSTCHSSPRGLSKAGGILGLDSFLREHYTASRETAGIIAAYLNGIDRGAPAAPPRARTARKPKAEEKPGDKKTEAKTSSGQPSDAKASEAKPADAKPADGGKSDKPQ